MRDIIFHHRIEQSKSAIMDVYSKLILKLKKKNEIG